MLSLALTYGSFVNEADTCNGSYGQKVNQDTTSAQCESTKDCWAHISCPVSEDTNTRLFPDFKGGTDDSSTTLLDQDVEDGNDEESYDGCYGCENSEELCTCERCVACGDKKISWIRETHKCDYNRVHEPEYCFKCHKNFEFDCTCEACVTCQQFLNHCRCPEVNRKVLVCRKAWIQKLNTGRITDPGWWGEEYPREMFVKVDCERTWVFSVKKPSAMIIDLTEALSNTSSKAYAKIRTGASRRYKRFYDCAYSRKVRFHLEKKNEGTHINVTTPNDVVKMMRSLAKLPRDGVTQALSFDCEGVDLGRDGVTCYIQIQDNVTRQAYLVDLLKLGQKAWTAEHNGHSLKSLFEDPKLIKLIYDIRGDSDALYAHYGIELAGVLDVQYLDLLNKNYCTLKRSRYTAAMSSSRCLNNEQQRQWAKDKSYPFDGDYSVFMERPLSAALKAYSINDVLFLDVLAKKLCQAAPQGSVEIAMDWTQREIQWTHEACYYEAHYDVEEFPAARAYVKEEFAADWHKVHMLKSV